MRVQWRVQFSCGDVDIDKMIIHDDNRNQGFFWKGGGFGGLGMKWGQGRGTRQREEQ